MLATAIGATFLHDSEEETAQSSSNTKPKQFGKSDVPIIRYKERNIYMSLCNAIIKTKDYKAVYTSIKELDRILNLDANIYASEDSEGKKFSVISSRFEYYLNNEDREFVNEKEQIKQKFRRLSRYIKYALVKGDRMSVDNYYKNHLKDESKKAYAKDIEQHAINFKNSLNKITQINDQILKDGVSSVPYCYYDLLNDAGELYHELVYANNKIGIITDSEVFSSMIVDEIAETILKNTNFYFCRGLSAPELSKDLTKHIIHFLHHHQPKLEETGSLKLLIEQLDRNYFSNRQIRHYYYFLILCARFVNTLKSNWNSNKILSDIKDSHELDYKIKELLFGVTSKYEFPFLEGLNEEEVWSHIIVTKTENTNS